LSDEPLPVGLEVVQGRSGRVPPRLVPVLVL